MAGRDKKRMGYPGRLSLSSMGNGATNHSGSSTYLQAREHDTRILQIFLRYGGARRVADGGKTKKKKRRETIERAKNKDGRAERAEKVELRKKRRGCISPGAAGVPIRSDSLFIIRRAYLPLHPSFSFHGVFT